MTTLVQVLALGLTAAGGTAVVLTRDPARQVFVSALYGMVLAILGQRREGVHLSLASGGTAHPRDRATPCACGPGRRG
ncbi:MAG: hypothetical protein NVSMB65_08320 [Chloroflexota bacterium]